MATVPENQEAERSALAIRRRIDVTTASSASLTTTPTPVTKVARFTVREQTFGTITEAIAHVKNLPQKEQLGAWIFLSRVVLGRKDIHDLAVEELWDAIDRNLVMSRMFRSRKDFIAEFENLKEAAYMVRAQRNKQLESRTRVARKWGEVETSRVAHPQATVNFLKQMSKLATRSISFDYAVTLINRSILKRILHPATGRSRTLQIQSDDLDQASRVAVGGDVEPLTKEELHDIGTALDEFGLVVPVEEVLERLSHPQGF